ncbi:hypothetical protein TNCV_4293971 [Trichonephila clavipes]|uniref:Uncharacterized protein n=1 Tax=Trichonephila clavipes TaxID=2585209 RepID=A0A8X6V443_TRICX|nr:hypothetical protein TNCV_4293971 [Trichonephila clavipes]
MSLDHGSKLRGPSPKALVQLNSDILIFNQSINFTLDPKTKGHAPLDVRKISPFLHYANDCNVFRSPNIPFFYAQLHCAPTHLLASSCQCIGSWLAYHEFEPSITKDPPCRGTIHVKSVESSNVLRLVWCGS